MSLQSASVNHLFYPPLGKKTSRTGIIPYAIVDFEEDSKGENLQSLPLTIADHRELWLLGTLPSGRLSDFGGSCLITEGETPYECIIREVDEESNGLLTDLIQGELDAAFILEAESKEDIPGLHVWRWVNQKRPDDISYLIFLQVDYEPLADISQEFTGNEENISIDWYDKDELLTNNSVKDFNTSIQKFLRHLGFSSK